MAQPLHPFTTGIDIKLALSAAFSAQFNSRGVEANYTPAWIATLQGACAFSNRLSVATEPYLSIPGGIINQLELNARGKELLERRQNLNAARENEAAYNPPAGSSRQSTRIPLLSAVKRSEEEIALQNAERDWRHENRSEKQKDREEGNANEVDFSFDVGTVYDSDAKDSRPDVAVAHIVGGTIRQPTMQDVRERYTAEGIDDLNRHLKRLISQYTARAGIKIVHRCGVLVGEFKRAPARAKADIIGIEVTDLLIDEVTPGPDDAEDVSNAGDIDWESKLRLLLDEAIEDTMRYCAVHFVIYPLSAEVIALASAGPFWQWATVKKEQVPSFNWLTGIAVVSEENDQLRDDFVPLFHQHSLNYYVLTTAESDAQINEIRNVMFNLINDSHHGYPTFPTDFSFTLIPDEQKE